MRDHRRGEKEEGFIVNFKQKNQAEYCHNESQQAFSKIRSHKTIVIDDQARNWNLETHRNHPALDLLHFLRRDLW